MAVDRPEAARLVFCCLAGKRYDDGSYWMGVTFPDSVIWPEERTSWTAAAVLLAYDALNNLTPAGCLFNHGFWENEAIETPEGSLVERHRGDHGHPVAPLGRIGG